MNEKKAAYVVVAKTTLEDLEEEVCEFIARGYVPTGGITLSFSKVAQGVFQSHQYYQALYLPESEVM